MPGANRGARGGVDASSSSAPGGMGAGRGGNGSTNKFQEEDGVEMEEAPLLKHGSRSQGTTSSKPFDKADEFDDGQALLNFADSRKSKNPYLEKCKNDLVLKEKQRKEREEMEKDLDPDVEEKKARDAILAAMNQQVAVPEAYHKIVTMKKWLMKDSAKKHNAMSQETYEEKINFDSAQMNEVRQKVLKAELEAARSKGLKIEQEVIQSFEEGGFDTDASIEWMMKAAAKVEESNDHLRVFMRQNDRMKAILGKEFNEADPEILKEYAETNKVKADINRSIARLVEQIEAAAKQEEEKTAAKKAMQAEIGSKDSAEEKIAQAQLAAKIKELRLQTVTANAKEYYVRIPLRLRIRLIAEEHAERASSYDEASKRWFTYEKVMHWFFYGDLPRVITKDEKLWMEKLQRDKEQARRRPRKKWSPYENVQFYITNKVGGNIGQVFTYYQFIMDNNFVMSNMWTFFVIIPFFFDPNDTFDMSKISWAGLIGMDDKGLEYSWFYYGSYKPQIDMGGWIYPMGVMYVVVYLAMFLFQLSVMLAGVFESVYDDMSIVKELDDPLEGIQFMATMFKATNFCITDAKVMYMNKLRILTRFRVLRKKMLEVKAEEAAKRSGSALVMAVHANPFGEEEENPRMKKIKIITGRTFGIIAYIGLFQISTNGIQFCYENEEAISGAVPYAVPILVTAMRVLVPLLMVPFFLGFEYREEPNLFYHTIIRMFALKVYTMNVILQVLLSTPVPGGICRAIFIGKVYWRQEIVDLLFCLVLDAIMTYNRRQMRVRPEFDEEELAERVMELLYRQAFIWVSAPYSPMLAYLGLCSTSILYFWQAYTIPISYSPPVNGWSTKQANKDFRVQLLCTAVATFLPTTIFLHQKMDCEPHLTNTTSSPYEYIAQEVRAGPSTLASITYWVTVPSTALALLMSSIGLQVFLSAVSTSRGFKVNTAIDTLGDERHDKVQLLRSSGMKI